MTRSRRVLRAVALFGTAAAGLLLAHELDYRLVVPDPTHRHDLLFRSGHGWLQHGLVIALVAGLLTLVTAIALGTSRARDRESGAMRVRALAPRLVMIQAGGFVLLEAVERILVGGPQDDRLLAVTLVGIVVQVLTALLGARLLTWIERVAHAVAMVFARTPPASRHAAAGLRPVAAASRGVGLLLRGSVSRRGPPFLLGS